MYYRNWKILLLQPLASMLNFNLIHPHKHLGRPKNQADILEILRLWWQDVTSVCCQKQHTHPSSSTTFFLSLGQTDVSVHKFCSYFSLNLLSIGSGCYFPLRSHLLQQSCSFSIQSFSFKKTQKHFSAFSVLILKKWSGHSLNIQSAEVSACTEWMLDTQRWGRCQLWVDQRACLLEEDADWLIECRGSSRWTKLRD